MVDIASAAVYRVYVADYNRKMRRLDDDYQSPGLEDENCLSDPTRGTTHVLDKITAVERATEG